MAFLTECYRSSMRLFRDRPDVLTPGRWYWCPPGARVVPYAIAFSTQFCDGDDHEVDPPVGEVPEWQGFADGKANPRYTGQNWCGGEDVWTRGALYSQRGTPAVDDQGVPFCCQSLAELPGGTLCAEIGDAFVSTLFFRLNFGPPFLFQDPGFVGGWADEGLFSSDQLLAEIGFAATTFDWTPLATPSFLPTLWGFAQAATSVPYSLVVPSGTFTVGVGLWVQSLQRVGVRLAAAVCVCDGVTGAVKQVVVPAHAVTGSLPLTGGFIAHVFQLAHGGYSCDPGDVFAVCVGLVVTRTALGFATFVVRYGFNGTERITVDGAPLTDPAPAISGLLPTEYADVPLPGTLVPYAGLAVPAGYLACDGASVLRTDFPDLFLAIGISWGAVDGAHFNVPDLRDRTVIGTSPGGLGPDRPTARAVADIAGEEDHVLVTAELASHAHPVTDPGHVHTVTDPGHSHTPAAIGPFWVTQFGGTHDTTAGTAVTESNNTSTDPTGITGTDAAATGITGTDPEGGGTGHNNMQPFAVIRWLVKT